MKDEQFYTWISGEFKSAKQERKELSDKISKIDAWRWKVTGGFLVILGLITYLK